MFCNYSVAKMLLLHTYSIQLLHLIDLVESRVCNAVKTVWRLPFVPACRSHAARFGGQSIFYCWAQTDLLCLGSCVAAHVDFS